MSDELASSSLSFMQKAGEITVQLLKILAPLARKGLEKLLADNPENLVGNVSQKELIASAQKAGSGIITNRNFLSADADKISRKALENKIPIHIIGDGEKRSISFRECDKAVLDQILQDVMHEKMRETPQDLKMFAVSECNVEGLKAEFEKNGLECQFVQGADEKIHCLYPAERAEEVAMIKADFKKAYSQIEMGCTITPNAPETERQTEIKAKIDKLKKSRENPEERSQMYDKIAAGLKEVPVYSENNMERIHEQMPDAKAVAGKAYWEKQGYSLNDNAKGVEIIAPQLGDDGKPMLDENGKQLFTTTTVYDISQTNAYEKAINNEIGKLQQEYDSEKNHALELSKSKSVIISDETSGKSVEINLDHHLSKADITNTLREELGYSELQSNIAINKLCSDLGLDRKAFSEPSQLDKINSMKVNIRYDSDSVLLRDTTFSSLNFKGSENTYIFVGKGDKQAVLTPAKMTETEMKSICVNSLEMSEEQAAETVSKAMKIDSQINSKLRETTVFRNTGEAQTVEIDRTSNNSFSVKLGTKQREYNFADADLAKKIGKDFGITEGKAQNIIAKAQKQSVFQNNLAKAAKAAKQKTSSIAHDLKKDTGKGVRR